MFHIFGAVCKGAVGLGQGRFKVPRAFPGCEEELCR